MIETKFAFFQMQQKLTSSKSVKLLHSTFRKRPETLDAVNVKWSNYSAQKTLC